jgi:dihydropteroate synthase
VTRPVRELNAIDLLASELHAVSEQHGGRERDFAVMGVVNVTPDSFSDGGCYLDPAAAIDRGLDLAREGATVLDVGGESTRPGAQGVAVEVELERVVPVIGGLVAARPPARISIDTSKARVAAAALALGATMVNDVTALRADPELAEVVASSRAELCIMHMLGTPRTMQDAPRYSDVVDEVKRFLEERLAFAVAHGVDERRIIVDPGIGFGKTVAHNVELIRRLGEIVAIGRPVLIGTSRKSFLAGLTGRPVDQRLAGTIASNVIAYQLGARLFRVHDVGPLCDALSVASALSRSSEPRRAR